MQMISRWWHRRSGHTVTPWVGMYRGRGHAYHCSCGRWWR